MQFLFKRLPTNSLAHLLDPLLKNIRVHTYIYLSEEGVWLARCSCHERNSIVWWVIQERDPILLKIKWEKMTVNAFSREVQANIVLFLRREINYFYPPPTKLQEGNVLHLFVCSQGGMMSLPVWSYVLSRVSASIGWGGERGMVLGRSPPWKNDLLVLVLLLKVAFCHGLLVESGLLVHTRILTSSGGHQCGQHTILRHSLSTHPTGMQSCSNCFRVVP